MLRDDYDFPDQARRAARHWIARLSAARALYELAADHHIERVGTGETIERLHQGHTTVAEGSGGTTGGWSLESFDVQYPTNVRRTALAKPWVSNAKPVQDETGVPANTAVVSLTAIADPSVAKSMIERLVGLERDLNALAEANELSEYCQGLLLEEVLPRIRELRTLLGRIAADEHERRELVKDSLVGVGKAAGALAAVGRLASGFSGLAKVPDLLLGGVEFIGSIAQHIG